MVPDQINRKTQTKQAEKAGIGVRKEKVYTLIITKITAERGGHGAVPSQLVIWKAMFQMLKEMAKADAHHLRPVINSELSEAQAAKGTTLL